MKNTAAIISVFLRPSVSASRPATNAPTAQPSSIEATLKPVPTSSESKAIRSPSTVPLITPLSKPNRNPPKVATATIAVISPRLVPFCEVSKIPSHTPVCCNAGHLC